MLPHVIPNHRSAAGCRGGLALRTLAEAFDAALVTLVAGIVFMLRVMERLGNLVIGGYTIAVVVS